MQKRVLFDHPATELRVFVVWADMLASDGKQAVQGASQMFRDARAEQYHDPARFVGLAFASGPFANYAAEAAASIPADHWLRTHLSRPDGDAPLWDIYMYFGPGQRWEEEPPRPLRWIQQAYHDPEKYSLYWLDDFAAPPIEGDLMHAIDRVTREFLAPAVMQRAPISR